MRDKPTFIDLNARPLDASSRLALPSPRVLYNDGEIPPSLSPLDAFAAQSRLMAKQLDVEKSGEKRISRLPPALVTKSLSQHRADRPTVFRSFSEESSGSRMKDENGPGSSPTIAHSHDRHISHHPRISEVAPAADTEVGEDEGFVTPIDRSSTTESTRQPPTSPDYFGFPRTDSPIPTYQAKVDAGCISSSVSRQEFHSRNDSSHSQLDPISAISSAVRPAPHRDSSDDDYTSSTAGSSTSYSRKLSSSSGISAPHSPLSPFVPAHAPRSPSINSEASANGISAQRPHLNFSRPRSTASLSIFNRTDSPVPHQSVTSHHRQPSATLQGALHAQAGDAESADKDGYLSAGGSSYTYARFSLPRGRMVARDSTIFQGLSTPHFEWKEPLFPEASLPNPSFERSLASTPSTPKLTLVPQQDNAATNELSFAFDFRAAQPTAREEPVQRRPSTSPSQSPKPTKSTKSVTSQNGRTSVEVDDIGSCRAAPAPKLEAEDAKSMSSKSNSTLRPTTSVRTGTTNATGYHYMSPDDHVTKGIECHENGSLNESTYHLRIAAMQNHPTAMLLYALACRHGWGMRPNQREGVQWLRKALDSAMLEVAEDEDPSATSGARDFHDKKARRAQFALSIYELGVSHLNGWGIEQDKALALRCFEVAGHWGDVDALTEAGFCYAQGIGCKKDLTKAAKFYRMAEQRGVNMVGNSWIYKDKYRDPDEIARSRPPARPTTPTRDKKSRDKSRTRSIFSRKKSFQPA